MSSKSSTSRQGVIPAQLDFFTIFNPSLGTSDETLSQQIVYFSNKDSPRKKQSHRSKSDARTEAIPDSSREVQNERLRQIGLAQGMVEFAKTFSDGQPVDYIETEKSRIVLHEIESGWWILASISLTRLPLVQKSKVDKDVESLGVEYSSREIKPSALILQDLLRAHATFLLHHAASLSALFVRGQRTKFMGILSRYWDTFLSSWSVLLHGNPAVNIYGGIKLAACGELGIGVGEEDRGSGEREVLEGFVGRVEGMVDLVVSKFGTAASDHVAEQTGGHSSVGGNLQPSQPWLGTGNDPQVDDGAIFLGTGALSRKSLRDITCWMEDLYSWGQHAYGVSTNVSNPDRRTKKNPITRIHSEDAQSAERPGLPTRSNSDRNNTAITNDSVRRSDGSKNTRASASSSSVKQHMQTEKNPTSRQQVAIRDDDNNVTVVPETSTTTEKLVSFLKLGYGTHWSLGMSVSEQPQDTGNTPSPSVGIPGRVTDLVAQESVRVVASQKSELPKKKVPSLIDDHRPHFLLGLTGDLESDERRQNSTSDIVDEDDLSEERILLRTLTVKLERSVDATTEARMSVDLGRGDLRTQRNAVGTSQHTVTSTSSWESQDRNKANKLRVVVYVNRPFIFTFLFELRTESLALTDLYKSLHHQLAPLQASLLLSTKSRLPRPDTTTIANEVSQAPIYDLVWDSNSLTVISTIPNIPEPMLQNATEHEWSRMEALNTHSQILNIHNGTRLADQELEHTSKTSRGWWVVWARITDVGGDVKASQLPGTSRSGSVTPQPIRPITWSIASVMEQNDHSKAETPQLRKTSTTGSSMPATPDSGPAHPFLETDLEPDEAEFVGKEIFLVRQASDHEKGRLLNAKAIVGESWTDWSGSVRLAQGIGVDTKRYIDGLLQVGR